MTTAEPSPVPPPLGSTQPNNVSLSPSIGGDGRYVAFTSFASNLRGAGVDLNNRSDVFIHDRDTGATTRVSVATDGTEANGASAEASISADGRFAAFSSKATNLVAGDTNARDDIFVHDLESATTTRVSVSSEGGQANNTSVNPSISATGRFVTLNSDASNLVAGDTNSARDVFVHDRNQAATTRVSVASDGAQGDKPSGDGNIPADITSDGRYVAFDSRATNLVSSDTNATFDIFVRDTGGPPEVSVGDVAVHEGDAATRAAVFTVSLSEPAPAAVTVAFATQTDTAAGTDFTAKSGTLSFAPGSTSATVKVPVTGDTADELNASESFNLVLSSPTGAVIGDGTGVGTIIDDDPATIAGRRLTIGDVTVHEGNAGPRVAVFNVSLSKASTSTVTAFFTTAKNTATGTDFTSKSGSLSFAPGITSLNVKVAINPDALVEGDETFTVHLSGASGAISSDATGVGTIIDND